VSFRTELRDVAAQSALEIYKELGSTCQYKDRTAAPVTLYCWAGAVSKDLAEILDVDAEAEARPFIIPKQAGFSAENVHLHNIIEFEEHNYHVLRTQNEDGLEAIFVLDAVCYHPLSIGAA
jgi:hypothetical protein